MPTRYVLPAEFQPASLVTTQQMDSPDGRKEAIAYIKTVFEEEDDAAAPADADYKSKSGSIVDVLADMKYKAEGQLASLSKAEMNKKQNFEMLEQSTQE